jgi:hypothetical protein
VNYNTIGQFNVYLFDGPHKKLDQYDGLAMAREALDDTFVFIVDDWNWREVREGTFDAIREARFEQIHAIEIRTTLDDTHPGDSGLPRDQASDWHNGYFISVLRKV